MQDLIDTTEMYLKAVTELEEQKVVPLRARIAERLGHSGPTVSQTVARLERDGLLIVGSDRRLELTAEGRELATSVMRKHRLAERLLSDVIGLEWPKVHNEACRWEHVMSDEVTEKLVAILPDATTSPYGNPIPGADVEADDAALPASELSLRAGNKRVRIVCFAEPLQVDENLLAQCERTGVVPGAEVEVSAAGDYVTFAVSGNDEVLDLPSEMAENVLVIVV